MAARTEYLTSHGDALLDLGDVLRASNKNDEAPSVYQGALRLFERKGNVVSAGRVRALLGTLSG